MIRKQSEILLQANGLQASQEASVMEVEEVPEETQGEPINNEQPTQPTTVQEPESAAQMEPIPTVAPESPQSARAFDNGEEGPVELPETSSSTAHVQSA